MKRKLVRMAVMPVLLFFCSGWGFLVHRTVNQLAVYQLPKSMRPFFYKNLNYLVKYSIRPDQRRNFDTKEAPKHFIDAEVYGDSSLWKMPQNWEAAVIKYTKDTLEKYGYVPYWVMIMKDKLTNAFRNGNKDSILFYVTDLGHYIGDAHVPLHTTVNYDGQLTDQKGLHALWESMIPEIEIDQYQLYNVHRARYLKSPEKVIWKTVRESYGLLNNIFLQEREASKQFTDSLKYRTTHRNGKEVKSYTSEFAKVYSKLLGNSINQRLLQSSNLCADFWYTCWVDAGKPNLNNLLQNSFTEVDRKNMIREYKAYRRNELIKDTLLIAKQGKEED